MRWELADDKSMRRKDGETMFPPSGRPDRSPIRCAGGLHSSSTWSTFSRERRREHTHTHTHKTKNKRRAESLGAENSIEPVIVVVVVGGVAAVGAEEGRRRRRRRLPDGVDGRARRRRQRRLQRLLERHRPSVFVERRRTWNDGGGARRRLLERHLAPVGGRAGGLRFRANGVRIGFDRRRRSRRADSRADWRVDLRADLRADWRVISRVDLRLERRLRSAGCRLRLSRRRRRSVEHGQRHVLDANDAIKINLTTFKNKMRTRMI